MTRVRCTALILVVMVAAGGCRVAPPTPSKPDSIATPAAAQKRPPGFLRPEERPDSLALLPPPPRDGSAQFAADDEIYRTTRTLRDTSRWRQAAADHNVRFPLAANVFACAAGFAVSAQAAPNLYTLLQRSVIDAGQSTLRAKDAYRRPRPFAVHRESTCVPEGDTTPTTNDSFPSGHASLGWLWALLLTELVPDRADAILARGHSFGQSRVICGLHWQSDVDAGRIVGSAVFARLHADAEFKRVLQAASKEVDAVRASAVAPGTDCAAEAAALSGKP